MEPGALGHSWPAHQTLSADSSVRLFMFDGTRGSSTADGHNDSNHDGPPPAQDPGQALTHGRGAAVGPNLEKRSKGLSTSFGNVVYLSQQAKN